MSIERDEPEFYGPWRLAKRTKVRPVTEMACVVFDDNGSPMCYAEDDYFMKTAIQRINLHDELVQALANLIDAVAGEQEDPGELARALGREAPSALAVARAAIKQARGE